MQLFTVQGHVIYAIKNNFFIFFFLKSIEMAYLYDSGTNIYCTFIDKFHYSLPLLHTVRLVH